jgi:hypothetical protein
MTQKFSISGMDELWQRLFKRYRAGGILCSVALLAAPAASQCGAPPPPEDLDMKESDFGCMKSGSKVGNFFVLNKLGHQQEAVAQAAATSPTGGHFPVGTILQLVPTEATVKRFAGFNAGSNDWEFFSLRVNPATSTSPASTTILARGAGPEILNQFGGSCFNCHSPAREKWDFVCAESHGCAPLPLTPALIAFAQDSDARCQ